MLDDIYIDNEVNVININTIYLKELNIQLTAFTSPLLKKNLIRVINPYENIFSRECKFRSGDYV